MEIVSLSPHTYSYVTDVAIDVTNASGRLDIAITDWNGRLDSSGYFRSPEVCCAYIMPSEQVVTALRWN